MTNHPEAVDTLLIGVGNEFREDDAVGLCVAREIRRRNAGAVTVVEVSGEGSGLMEAWAGARQVIIVDAMFSGGVPGSIRRFDATAEEVPRRYFHYSTHSFGVAEAIETARKLGTLPPHLLLYGIEGKEFGTGVGLSDPVVKSVPALIAMIEEDLHAFHAV
ncbi:MAG: hydrogenase maturation protease [Bacteroidota bacterium]